MKRQPSRKDADVLFSRFIRLRDGCCQRCGTSEGLQCAHVVSRRYAATRFDPQNAMALCVRCHMWQTTHPLEGDEFFIGKLGAEKFDALKRRALAGLQGRHDYRLLVSSLRDRLKEMAA